MDINRKSSNVKKLVYPTKTFYKQLYQKIHELKGKKRISMEIQNISNRYTECAENVRVE